MGFEGFSNPQLAKPAWELERFADTKSSALD